MTKPPVTPRTDAKEELAAWERAFDKATEIEADGTPLWRKVPPIALDGIALVESRTIEYASHEVRFELSAAVSCSCQHHSPKRACAHRMAGAIAQYAKECEHDAYQTDVTQMPRARTLHTLIDNYLELPETVKRQRNTWLREKLMKRDQPPTEPTFERLAALPKRVDLI